MVYGRRASGENGRNLTASTRAGSKSRLMDYLGLPLIACFLLPSCAVTNTYKGREIRFTTYPNGCSFFDAFIENGDGTITDPRNGLIWQKCALGFNWNGKNCVGEMSYKSWGRNWWRAMEEAKANRFLQKKDWRLPTEQEYLDITGDISKCRVDAGKYGFAVSSMLAHPVQIMNSWDYKGPYPGVFWSSTPQSEKKQPERKSSNAVDANFLVGMNHQFAGIGVMRFNDNIGVRLVRSDSPAGKNGYEVFEHEYQLRIEHDYERNK